MLYVRITTGALSRTQELCSPTSFYHSSPRRRCRRRRFVYRTIFAALESRFAPSCPGRRYISRRSHPPRYCNTEQFRSSVANGRASHLAIHLETGPTVLPPFLFIPLPPSLSFSLDRIESSCPISRSPANERLSRGRPRENDSRVPVFTRAVIF